MGKWPFSQCSRSAETQSVVPLFRSQARDPPGAGGSIRSTTGSHPVGPPTGAHVPPAVDRARTGGEAPSAGLSCARIVPSAPEAPTASNVDAPEVALTSCQLTPSAVCQSPPDSSTACQPPGTGHTADARAFAEPDHVSDRRQVRPSDDSHATAPIPALSWAHAPGVETCAAPTRTTSCPFVVPADRSASGTFSSPGGPSAGQLRTLAASVLTSQLCPSRENSATGSWKFPRSPKST